MIKVSWFSPFSWKPIYKKSESVEIILFFKSRPTVGQWTDKNTILYSLKFLPRIWPLTSHAFQLHYFENWKFRNLENGTKELTPEVHLGWSALPASVLEISPENSRWKIVGRHPKWSVVSTTKHKHICTHTLWWVKLEDPKKNEMKTSYR